MSKLPIWETEELTDQEIQCLPNGIFVYTLEYRLKNLWKATATQIAEILWCSHRSIPALLKKMSRDTDFAVEFANGMSNSQKYITLTAIWASRILEEFDKKLFPERNEGIPSNGSMTFEIVIRDYNPWNLSREVYLEAWRRLKETQPQLFKWWCLVPWWLWSLTTEIDSVNKSKNNQIGKKLMRRTSNRPRRVLSFSQAESLSAFFRKK